MTDVGIPKAEKQKAQEAKTKHKQRDELCFGRLRAVVISSEAWMIEMETRAKQAADLALQKVDNQRKREERKADKIAVAERKEAKKERRG